MAEHDIQLTSLNYLFILLSGPPDDSPDIYESTLEMQSIDNVPLLNVFVINWYRVEGIER